MLIQLHPNHDGHWALYEAFERRCMEFGKREGCPLTVEFVQEMRTRWITTPRLTGYFLTDDREAHALSWVVPSGGRLGIMIYQGDMPAGQLPALLGELFGKLMPIWLTEIEQVIKRPVDMIELSTRRPEPWQRLLAKYVEINDTRTTFSMTLKKEA